ncbi:MAG TPA: phosphatase PAP2 family protein [Stellaceae bacterium]|nr:phosphatase PAP2 family protein [Stellaceae bacterium]
MRGVAIYAGLVAAAVALFLVLPQIDLWTSGLFYVEGRGFVLAAWPPVLIVFDAVPWLAWGIVAIVAGAAAWLFLTGRPLWRLDRKALVFVALSTALGPGLLANTVFKDHWGRARPVQIAAFGGVHRFTPAPLPARECATNCSFVSGHAALGFSLVAFAMLLPPGRRRRRATGAALAGGGLIGLVRIAQGGHFLSDVVFAGLLVYGTAALCHWWIVERDGFAAPPLLRLYRLIGRVAASAWRRVRRFPPSPVLYSGAAVAGTTVLVVLSIAFVDRPLALYMHARGPDLHALFGEATELGEGWGWLVLFALLFAALHWGGELPRLHRLAPKMRALSVMPAFVFAAIAASGLIVDLMKIGFGRLRPKLLFSAGLYGFTWFGWRPDHWSFPSGHAATFVALVTALWWRWPQHLLFYILAAAIVTTSRVVVGAHYPSDVLAGALIAVLTTRQVALLFTRWGVAPAAPDSRRQDAGSTLPWPCRRGTALVIRASATWHRARQRRAGRPLAPAEGGVVSARHHGAADRDV